MKRRNFITGIAGLFTLPFVAKNASATPTKSFPHASEWKKYVFVFDPPSPDGDRHSSHLMRLDPDGSVKVIPVST